MLDTNICVYVMNESDPALRDHFVLNTGSLCISSIAYAELSYGVAHSRRMKHNQSELRIFVKDLDVLPFGTDGAEHYGAIRQALTKKGSLIGANDLLIAAHARSIDATLVTNNVREFRRVPKLRITNWLKEAK